MLNKSVLEFKEGLELLVAELAKEKYASSGPWGKPEVCVVSEDTAYLIYKNACALYTTDVSFFEHAIKRFETGEIQEDIASHMLDIIENTSDEDLRLIGITQDDTARVREYQKAVTLWNSEPTADVAIPEINYANILQLSPERRLASRIKLERINSIYNKSLEKAETDSRKEIEALCKSEGKEKVWKWVEDVHNTGTIGIIISRLNNAMAAAEGKECEFYFKCLGLANKIKTAQESEIYPYADMKLLLDNQEIIYLASQSNVKEISEKYAALKKKVDPAKIAVLLENGNASLYAWAEFGAKGTFCPALARVMHLLYKQRAGMPKYGISAPNYEQIIAMAR